MVVAADDGREGGKGPACESRAVWGTKTRGDDRSRHVRPGWGRQVLRYSPAAERSLRSCQRHGKSGKTGVHFQEAGRDADGHLSRSATATSGEPGHGGRYSSGRPPAAAPSRNEARTAPASVACIAKRPAACTTSTRRDRQT